MLQSLTVAECGWNQADRFISAWRAAGFRLDHRGAAERIQERDLHQFLKQGES
jgi:hypothetical protein